MKQVEQVGVAFHDGHVIMYLSQLYADPISVIRELVQNPLDKGAKNIIIEIDAPNRIIKCYDDGRGASKDEIIKKFKSVGDSLKVGDPEAIGEKGIGNLAGIAISQRYRLITKDQENKHDWFRIYTLDKSEMRNASVNLNVEDWPSKVIGGKMPFEVSTLVALDEINEMAIRQLSNMNSLEREIIDAFNRKISKDKVTVKICYRGTNLKRAEKIIKPHSFSGTRMDRVEYNTEFGKVEFDFYYLPKPVENPRLLVEHQGVFSVNLSNFFKRKQLAEDIAEVVHKGYFEGLIKLDFCTLAASRDCFEWNKELEAFAGVVNQFTTEILKSVIEKFQEEEKQEKYRRISEIVLRRISDHIKLNPELLPPKFRKFVPSDFGAKKEVGKIEKKIKIRTSALKEEKEKKDKEKAEKKTVQKPDSGKSNKGDISIRPIEGLSLAYVLPDEESSFSWHSRTNPEGFIEINVANNDFLSAEKRGMTRLVDYVFMIFCKELTCGSLEPMVAKLFSSNFESIFLKFMQAS